MNRSKKKNYFIKRYLSMTESIEFLNYPINIYFKKNQNFDEFQSRRFFFCLPEEFLDKILNIFMNKFF